MKIGDQVFLNFPIVIDGCAISLNDAGEIIDAHDSIADYWFVAWDTMLTAEHTTPATWIHGQYLIAGEDTTYIELTGEQRAAILQYEKDREDLESKQE